MTEYALIDPGEAPYKAILGDCAEPLQLHIMRGTECRAGEALEEGMWEYRHFANGALALVFRDSHSRYSVRNELGHTISASPEAISLSMNLLALKDHQQVVPDELVRKLEDLYLALKEALIHEQPSLILAPLTKHMTTRKPVDRREGRLRPHSEAVSIIHMEG